METEEQISPEQFATGLLDFLHTTSKAAFDQLRSWKEDPRFQDPRVQQCVATIHNACFDYMVNAEHAATKLKRADMHTDQQDKDYWERRFFEFETSLALSYLDGQITALLQSWKNDPRIRHPEISSYVQRTTKKLNELDAGLDHPEFSFSYDENYEDWGPGDTIEWEEPDGKRMILKKIDEYERVFWDDPETGEECMTRATNMRRVKRREH